jgi:hypothetical protein
MKNMVVIFMQQTQGQIDSNEWTAQNAMSVIDGREIESVRVKSKTDLEGFIGRHRAQYGDPQVRISMVFLSGVSQSAYF